MSFWTDNSIEPKRQNRWVVQFEGLDPGNLYFATKVTRPTIEITTKEYKFLNHTFNYPGRVVWNKVTLTIVDPGGAAGASGADAMASLTRMIAEAGYVVPNTDAGGSLGTISKSKAVAAAANSGGPSGVSLNPAIPGIRLPGLPIAGGNGIVSGGGAKSILIKMIGPTGDSDVVEKWELVNAFVSKITPSELSYEDDGMATVDIEITYDFCKFNDTRFTPT